VSEPLDPSELPRRLDEHLRERPELLPRGADVLVAVSGGPDSMGLLHLLAGLAGRRGLSLSAAHFDHGLRAGSGEEAARVRGWVADLGVRCTVGGPARRLPSKQEALRRARYAFLRAVADQEGADRIATGHHADDQVETVLFRILRGTGLRGLRGIPARRGRVARPLLPFAREAIGAWVEERDVPHLRDPSNRDPGWSRGRLRSRVLPALEEAWGEPVREPLLALSRHAARADRALEGHARHLLQRARDEPEADRRGGWPDDAVRLRRRPLAEADPETRARALRVAAREQGVRLTEGGTRSAAEFISRGRSGGRVDLGEGRVLAREFGHLWLGRPPEPTPDGELRIPGPGPGRGRVTVGGRELSVRWGPAGAGDADHAAGADAASPTAPGDGPADPSGGGRGGAAEGYAGGPPAPRRRLAVPAGRAGFPLTLRGWRDGDRIRTPAGSRKLKRLFNDRRVPLSRRPRIPTLVTASGRTLWVAGLARDPRSVPGNTEERLVIIVDDA
jgi:tRNA(Ile)-lysidine synthase